MLQQAWEMLQKERGQAPAFDFVFIENIGNLVCPASYNLGEHLRVVLLSVPEGEDKPPKYPKAFHSADVVLLTKLDVLPHFDFRVEEATRMARELNPRVEVLQLSSRTGKGWTPGSTSWCRAERPPWTSMNAERLQIRVVGVVQGVGFRPFVYRLAERLGLTGWVRNDGDGVTIEVEGEHGRLLQFGERLVRERPVASVLYAVDHRWIAPQQGAAFEIRPSEASTTPRAWVLPDLAVCEACRAEVLDPGNRRYRYRSRIARIAGRDSRSSQRCPMTGRTPRWLASRCVRAARRSTTTRAIAASTRSPMLAPHAALACAASTPQGCSWARTTPPCAPPRRPSAPVASSR